MGNKNLSKIKLENFPEKRNDLIFSNSNPEKDKAAANKEKQKMKLISKHNKEMKDSTLIEECLISHTFLRALEKQARQEIIKEVSLFFVKSNEEIYRQGETPGCFYILKSGTCDIIVNGEKKEILQKGNIFGDTDLLYGTERQCTVKASTECNVWVMDKKNFKKVIEHMLHITFEDNNSNAGKIPLFSTISQDQRTKLINNVYRETYLENHMIYGKGSAANCLYVLKDGGINIKKDGKLITTLAKGDCFGLMEVIAGTNRIFEASAKEKTHLLTIPVFWLNSLYGDNFRSVVALSMIKYAFSNNPSLKKLNLKFLDEMFNFIQFKYYEKDSVIMKAGEPKNSLILVCIEGELLDADSGKIICERNNVLYGKEIYEDDSSKSSISIKCKQYSLLAIAKMSDVKNHFKCSLKSLGEKSSFIEQLRKVNLFKNFTNAKLENLQKKNKSRKSCQWKKCNYSRRRRN